MLPHGLRPFPHLGSLPPALLVAGARNRLRSRRSGGERPGTTLASRPAQRVRLSWQKVKTRRSSFQSPGRAGPLGEAASRQKREEGGSNEVDEACSGRIGR